jgi:hypothetical protein
MEPTPSSSSAKMKAVPSSLRGKGLSQTQAPKQSREWSFDSNDYGRSGPANLAIASNSISAGPTSTRTMQKKKESMPTAKFDAASTDSQMVRRGSNSSSSRNGVNSLADEISHPRRDVLSSGPMSSQQPARPSSAGRLRPSAHVHQASASSSRETSASSTANFDSRMSAGVSSGRVTVGYTDKPVVAKQDRRRDLDPTSNVSSSPDAIFPTTRNVPREQYDNSQTSYSARNSDINSGAPSASSRPSRSQYEYSAEEYQQPLQSNVRTGAHSLAQSLDRFGQGNGYQSTSAPAPAPLDRASYGHRTPDTNNIRSVNADFTAGGQTRPLSSGGSGVFSKAITVPV